MTTLLFIQLRHVEKNVHPHKEAGTLVSADDTVQLSAQREWGPHEARDVSCPQPLSCTAFLDFTSGEPSADMPSVVQVPGMTIEEPGNDEVVNVETGARLWGLSKGRDPKGNVRMRLPQRVAFRLAQADDQQ